MNIQLLDKLVEKYKAKYSIANTITLKKEILTYLDSTLTKRYINDLEHFLKLKYKDNLSARTPSMMVLQNNSLVKSNSTPSVLSKSSKKMRDYLSKEDQYQVIQKYLSKEQHQLENERIKQQSKIRSELNQVLYEQKKDFDQKKQLQHQHDKNNCKSFADLIYEGQPKGMDYALRKKFPVETISPNQRLVDIKNKEEMKNSYKNKLKEQEIQYNIKVEQENQLKSKIDAVKQSNQLKQSKSMQLLTSDLSKIKREQTQLNKNIELARLLHQNEEYDRKLNDEANRKKQKEQEWMSKMNHIAKQNNPFEKKYNDIEKYIDQNVVSKDQYENLMFEEKQRKRHELERMHQKSLDSQMDDINYRKSQDIRDLQAERRVVDQIAEQDRLKAISDKQKQREMQVNNQKFLKSQMVTQTKNNKYYDRMDKEYDLNKKYMNKVLKSLE